MSISLFCYCQYKDFILQFCGNHRAAGFQSLCLLKAQNTRADEDYTLLRISCSDAHFSHDTPGNSVLDILLACFPAAGEPWLYATKSACLSRSARKRPKLTSRERLLWTCLSRLWAGWHSALAIVKSETEPSLGTIFRPRGWLGAPPRTRFSVGIAGYLENGLAAEELLHAADSCWYESKANGRDCVTVTTSHNS